MQKPTLKPLPKPLKALLKQPLKALPTQLLLLLVQPLKPLKQPLKPLKAPLLLLKKLLSKLFATSESGRAVPQGAALFFGRLDRLQTDYVVCKQIIPPLNIFPLFVIPANAGIQGAPSALDPRVRGDDN